MINLIFDHSKLRGKIREVIGSEQDFCKLMNLSPTTMTLKLNGKRKFTQLEMRNAISILEIDTNEISEYFFKIKVRETEQ